MNKKIAEDAAMLAQVQEELANVRAERDKLFADKMKVEEVVDIKDGFLAQMTLELQRAREEVACRKLIIE